MLEIQTIECDFFLKPRKCVILLEPDFQAVQAGLGPQSINPSHSGGTAQAAPSGARGLQ